MYLSILELLEKLCHEWHFMNLHNSTKFHYSIAGAGRRVFRGGGLPELQLQLTSAAAQLIPIPLTRR